MAALLAKDVGRIAEHGNKAAASIGYFEVVAGDTPAELRRVVERLFGGKA
jgi:hypothetical protein